jgi:hypothetical protein
VRAPTARRQLHVYAFRAPGGGVDVYAHEERSWSHDPEGHLTDTNQEDGDPEGRVVAALRDAGIEVTVADAWLREWAVSGGATDRP